MQLLKLFRPRPPRGTVLGDMSRAGHFGPLASIYPFTTENLAGYLPGLSLQGKRVLTVSASGDHVLNAWMFGAKDVQAFDLNLASRHYTELKLAALQTLDRRAFIDFFTREGDDPLCMGRYQKMRGRLGEDARAFWDRVYAEAGRGDRLRRSALFKHYPSKEAQWQRYNPYLQSDEGYALARANAAGKPLDWVQADVSALPRLTRGPFDVVLLSNVADYTPKGELPAYGRMMEALGERLAPRGTVVAAYVYTGPKHSRTLGKVREIDDPALRRQALDVPGWRYLERELPGAELGMRDRVVLLTKPGAANELGQA